MVEPLNRLEAALDPNHLVGALLRRVLPMTDPLPVNEAERALDAEDDAPRGRVDRRRGG